MNQQPGVLARKIGMTQIFEADGTRVPVTVLLARGNAVVAHRTLERDGYTALQLGIEEQKASRMTKADLGRFQQANVSPRKHVREIRCPADVVAKYPVGTDIPLDMFEAGSLLDITGTTKGKGFQGIMKRHKAGGKNATHGVHEYFRHGGSIGCRLTPGRVFKGKRMGGHMGSVRQTTQNIRLVRVMADEGLLLVKGTVPGHRDSYVVVRTSHKAALRKASAEAKAAAKASGKR
jgi:large subunit ribosomal protein L3